MMKENKDIFSRRPQIEASQIDTFVNKDWNAAWNICKAHKKTTGMSKQSIRMMRPGYVNLWINELSILGKLTQEQISQIWN